MAVKAIDWRRIQKIRNWFCVGWNGKCSPYFDAKCQKCVRKIALKVPINAFEKQKVPNVFKRHLGPIFLGSILVLDLLVGVDDLLDEPVTHNILVVKVNDADAVNIL